MSIPSLVEYLSADVCKQLIAAGFVAYTLTVVGASDTAPIVIETQQNHLLLKGAVVNVSGVVGNTAANDDWNVTPVDATHFELDNSISSAAWVSGGTVKVALVTGKIMLGRQFARQNKAAPTIIFIPISGEFLPRDHYAVIPSPASDQTTAQVEANKAPSVQTHRDVFEVQVWGKAPDGTAPEDVNDAAYTSTEFMRDMVIRVADQQLRGNFTARNGQWQDQAVNATQDMKLGHQYIFQLTIDTPITVTPKEIVPPGVTATIGVYFIPADGSPPGELAVSIET